MFWQCKTTPRCSLTQVFYCLSWPFSTDSELELCSNKSSGFYMSYIGLSISCSATCNGLIEKGHMPVYGINVLGGFLW